jgi:hypothetical protein
MNWSPKVTDEGEAVITRPRLSLRRASLIFGSLIAAGVLIAAVGCSDSSDDGSSTGGGDDNGAIVTGSAKCDRASMEEAVQAWAKAYGNGEKASLPDTADSYTCADGWAVAFPDVGPEQTAVTVTAVFEAEGQFWIPKDRAKVCGEKAPDSEVPASLIEQACQTN